MLDPFLSPAGRDLNIDLADVRRIADVSMNVARMVYLGDLVLSIPSFGDPHSDQGTLSIMAVAWLACTLLTLWSYVLYLDRARRPREDVPVRATPSLDNGALALTRIATKGTGRSGRLMTMLFGKRETTPESFKEVIGCSLAVIVAATIPVTGAIIHAPAQIGGVLLPVLAFWLSGTVCALVAYLAKSRAR